MLLLHTHAFTHLIWLMTAEKRKRYMNLSRCCNTKINKWGQCAFSLFVEGYAIPLSIWHVRGDARSRLDGAVIIISIGACLPLFCLVCPAEGFLGGDGGSVSAPMGVTLVKRGRGKSGAAFHPLHGMRRGVGGCCWRYESSFLLLPSSPSLPGWTLEHHQSR